MNCWLCNDTQEVTVCEHFIGYQGFIVEEYEQVECPICQLVEQDHWLLPVGNYLEVVK